MDKIASLFSEAYFIPVYILLLVFIIHKYKKFIAKKKKDKELEQLRLKEEQKRLEEEQKLEQKRLEEEQKEAEKKAKIEAFHNSVDIDSEIVSILSIIESKNAVSISNFEKGLEHLLEKNGNPCEVKDILLTAQKALFHRAIACKDQVAIIIATQYFIIEVVKGSPIHSIRTRFKFYSYADDLNEECAHSYIQAVYGIAGRVLNYFKYITEGNSEYNYQAITPEDFLEVIENSKTLKSITDTDPFIADETRKQWAEKLYKAPLDIVKYSALNEIFDNEVFIDRAYFLMYEVIYESLEDGSDYKDNISIEKIAFTHLTYFKKLYGDN